MLKKHVLSQVEGAASGALALLPFSRTQCTLHASTGLRPCWTNLFENSLQPDDARLILSVYWPMDGIIQQTLSARISYKSSLNVRNENNQGRYCWWDWEKTI